MKNLDIPKLVSREATDSNTGSEKKPPKMRRRGRPKGSKNKIGADARAILAKYGSAGLRQMCAIAAGRSISRIGASGCREKLTPDLDQMITAQKAVIDRLVPALKATELTGKDGEPLLPEREPVNKRQVSRAILSILGQAKLEEAPEVPESPPQPEQMLIGRDPIIEINPEPEPAPINGTPTAGDPPHGEKIYITENNAEIVWQGDRRIWRVIDASGMEHMHRRTKAEALAFAETLPAPSLKSLAGRDQPPSSDHAAPFAGRDEIPFRDREPRAVRRRPR